MKKKRTRALTSVKIFSVLMALMLCLTGWGGVIASQANTHLPDEIENSYPYDDIYNIFFEENTDVETIEPIPIDPMELEILEVHIEEDEVFSMGFMEFDSEELKVHLEEGEVFSMGFMEFDSEELKVHLEEGEILSMGVMASDSEELEVYLEEDDTFHLDSEMSIAPFSIEETVIHVEQDTLIEPFSSEQSMIHMQPDNFLPFTYGQSGYENMIEMLSTGPLTVTYNGNGHTGGMVPVGHSVNTPGSFTVRAPGTMVRTNHHFTGWRLSSNGQIVQPGTVIRVTVPGTLRLDAQWRRNTVTVTYAGNGHTGGTVPAGHTVNTPGTFTVRAPGSMVRTNHHFTGWRLSTNGQIVQPGTVISLTGRGTLRLDAQWRRNAVTVTYAGNGHTGGTVPAGHTVNTPGSFTVRAPGSMVRTNHHFTGWRLSTTGQIVQPGTVISLTGRGTLRLDAQWRRNAVTVTYAGNGHTGGTVPAGHTVNTPGTFTVRAPGNLVRTNHHFTGWRLSTTGQIVQPGTVISLTGHGTLRLDAQWRRNVVTVTYAGNGHTGGTVPAGHTVNTPGSFTVRAPGSMVRTNHHFTGWRLSTTGQIVQPGTVISLTGHGTLRLDAQWRRNVVTVTYAGNGHTGGAVPAGHTINTPGSFTVRAPGSLVRTNHHFTGWRLSTTGQIVQPGAVISLTGHGTLRLDAQWTPLVRLTFNPNGGTVSPTFRDVPRGSVVSNLPTPTRSDRHFVDWFNTSATTGGNRLRNGMNAPNGNTTYWARWTDPSRHLHYWSRPANSGTTVINVRNFGYNPIWHNAMLQGISNWNGSSARVHFNRVASSDNRIIVEALHDDPGVLGTLTPSRNGTNLTSFTIRLYSESINNYVTRNRNNNPNGYAESVINTNITVARVIESVMTHELGHAIGLADNPSGATAVNASIMNSRDRRQRWVRRAPSTFDNTSVNMIY